MGIAVGGRGRRIDEIEVLRGIAVIFVIVWHFWGNLPGLPNSYLKAVTGWTNTSTGVDLFFAISGFVIARDLVPRLEAAAAGGRRRRTVFAFWIRRIWRLTPSAWFWLFVIVLAAAFFNDSGVWGSVETNLWGALSAVLNYANIRFAMLFGESFFGAAFPYWSLSLEEQFYFVLPLLVILLGRKLPYLLVALVVLQLVFPRSLLMTMLRTDAIALGVLLAIWSSTANFARFEPKALAAHPLLRSFVCLALFIGLATLASRGLDLPRKLSLIAFVSAVLVFLASWDKGYLMKAGPLRAALVWVGARSYALYLIHIPAMFAVRELLHRGQPLIELSPVPQTVAIFVSASVLMAWLAHLNFRHLEMPLKRKGAEMARRVAEGPGATPS